MKNRRFAAAYLLFFISFVKDNETWLQPNTKLTLVAIKKERSYLSIILKFWFLTNNKILFFNSQYDLVCDKTFLASLASSMIFAGWFFGALLGGWIADKHGRKPIVYVSAFMISLWGLLSAIPKVYWFYVVARFLVGICRGRFSNLSSGSKHCLVSIHTLILPMNCASF